MRKFAATATNAAGLRFRFIFFNVGWHDMKNVAKIALDEIVASDSLHQKHGPWTISNIDVTL